MRKLFELAMMAAAVALGAACSTPSDAACSGGCGCDGYNYCESDDDIAPPQDGGRDATIDATTCAVGALSTNAAACPATYNTSLGGQACSPVGLLCDYAGYGDEIGTDGCPEPAELFCQPGDPSLDSGLDAASSDDAGGASVGHWVVGQ